MTTTNLKEIECDWEQTGGMNILNKEVEAYRKVEEAAL